jgi:hypothetical protein
MYHVQLYMVQDRASGSLVRSMVSGNPAQQIKQEGQ